jgi:hypothetical protein
MILEQTLQKEIEESKRWLEVAKEAGSRCHGFN